MSDLSRRGLLGGAVAIGAAGVALVAPAIATAGTATAAAITTQSALATSPFVSVAGIVKTLHFPLFKLDVAFSPSEEVQSRSPFEAGENGEPLQLVAAPDRDEGSRLSIRINKATEDDAEEFATLRDLYDEAFGAPMLVGPNPDPIALQITIHRQANLIAARSRRGAGNIILHSPNTELRETLNLLDKHAIFKMHESQAVADDELIVFYDGGTGLHDGPFMAEVREDGTVRAVVRRNSVNSLGNSSDMGVIIRAA